MFTPRVVTMGNKVFKVSQNFNLQQQRSVANLFQICGHLLLSNVGNCLCVSGSCQV